MCNVPDETPRAMANNDSVAGLHEPDPLIGILAEALAEAEEAAYNWENACKAANARIAELMNEALAEAKEAAYDWENACKAANARIAELMNIAKEK